MHDYGGPEQLVYEQAPDPELHRPDDVIVKLAAASLNHILSAIFRFRLSQRQWTKRLKPSPEQF